MIPTQANHPARSGTPQISHGAGPRPASSRPGRRRWAVLPIAGLALLLLTIAFLEGDLSDSVADLGALVGRVLNRFGGPASFALLYVEESGVPMVIPGDVYVAYLAKLAAGSAPKLIASWLGSSPWSSPAPATSIGPPASGGAGCSTVPGERPAPPRRDRLAQAEAWLARWGVLAIIFGRHVPGLRIPITVVAGTLKVRFTTFLPSVAVSSAAWAALGLWLGAMFGQSIDSFLTGNRLIYLLVVVAVVLVVAFVVVQIWRHTRRPDSSSPDRQRLLSGKLPGTA